ncbi:hypothetical protein AKJ65_02570 [candidate division MSBL1 archaeon SCGC-AAA259E19]|uniref:Uncharacterized protein n=1 Tax=candidate division MSBL1 archaeon SCGC-AAA259E19 TaxID=1698264 RepID=A0A133ULQ0_9EURY|nr:hypothetical protein AKJ65_02570 [candidate division MSBL1 archaeon SCGC-AAA259E19]
MTEFLGLGDFPPGRVSGPPDEVVLIDPPLVDPSLYPLPGERGENFSASMPLQLPLSRKNKKESALLEDLMGNPPPLLESRGVLDRKIRN